MISTEAKIKAQVEKIGVVCDKDGFPPLAGRLLGFLMLAEPPHKTFDEIVEFLQASKSAVSNTLKFLEAQKMVDYITFPGDRKRYFRMSVENWGQVVGQRLDFLVNMQEKVKEVLAIRSGDHPEFNEGLHNIYLLYQTFIDELPRIIQKWEEAKKNYR
jgi:DNA-binding transcriptional regulator GbsR (MarR family)